MLLSPSPGLAPGHRPILGRATVFAGKSAVLYVRRSLHIFHNTYSPIQIGMLDTHSDIVCGCSRNTKHGGAYDVTPFRTLRPKSTSPIISTQANAWLPRLHIATFSQTWGQQRLVLKMGQRRTRARTTRRFVGQLVCLYAQCTDLMCRRAHRSGG